MRVRPILLSLYVRRMCRVGVVPYGICIWARVAKAKSGMCCYCYVHMTNPRAEGPLTDTLHIWRLCLVAECVRHEQGHSRVMLMAADKVSLCRVPCGVCTTCVCHVWMCKYRRVHDASTQYIQCDYLRWVAACVCVCERASECLVLAHTLQLIQRLEQKRVPHKNGSNIQCWSANVHGYYTEARTPFAHTHMVFNMTLVAPASAVLRWHAAIWDKWRRAKQFTKSSGK